MCPYVVTNGDVLWGGARYGLGQAIPAGPGEADDMVAVGAVKWVDEPAADPVPPALSAAGADLAHHKAENVEASQAARVLESARKRAPKGGGRR